MRQVRTVADMQTIVAGIEALRAQSLSERQLPIAVRREVLSVAKGQDAWHHDLVYLIRRKGSEFSYVLVSMGSDGKMDMAGSDVYFTMPEHMARAEPWEDIVFRDGHMITRAGK
jgi:hypothetical protein